MKPLSVFVYFIQNKRTKRNFIDLSKFLLFLVGIVCLYSAIFHILMHYEGRDYSWITSFYWVLTVMSTLGFGDITFYTDLGKFFTLVVLVSGVLFFLILLPFTFVRFFYQPWLEAQQKARTPMRLSEDVSEHIIITNLCPITSNLITKLKKYHYPYVVIEPEIGKAQEMHDAGYNVVVGDYDNPATYERIRLHKSRLVVTTKDDLTNTSIAFTVREVSDKVPIVSNADNEHTIDILEFTGNAFVFEFTKMLGRNLAKRTQGIGLGASVLGSFGRLQIAEVPVGGTPFEGKKLINTKIRQKTGLTVVGLWERGKFQIPMPQTIIKPSMVMVLAGSEEQLAKYDELYDIVCSSYDNESPVLILGCGKVGRAAAEKLDEYDIAYTIVEKNQSVVKRISDNCIQGDAADISTLRSAGIENARSVLITTHTDAMNIYLTFYCRQLRHDVKIIARAIEERTVSKLYRAGADLVISSASLGANSILNILRPNELSMFTEGLNIFSMQVRESLIGKSLLDSQIRQLTGCTVIAINYKGKQNVSPNPGTVFKKHDELILIGTTEAEAHFFETF